MLGQTIGNWTPGQLQNYLQTIVRLEPSVLPSSLRSVQLESDVSRVYQQLDFNEAAQLLQEGIIFDPLTFLGAGLAGIATPMFAETIGTALWRAGGGTILAQNFDLPDGGDEYTSVDGTQRGASLYLPARAEVSSMHVYVSTASTAYAGTLSVTLYKMTGADMSTPSLELIETVTPGALSLDAYTLSTGLMDFPFTDGHVLDAGVYVISIYTNWTSITGSLKYASKNAARAAQNQTHLGGPMRVLTQNNQAPVDPWTPTNAANERPWVGLS